VEIPIVGNELVLVITIEFAKPIERLEVIVGCVLHRLRDARQFKSLAKGEHLVGIAQGDW